MKSVCILIGLLALACIGWLSYFTETQTTDQLRTERDGQAAQIARSAFIFQQFNRITAANEADRLKAHADSAERVIEYRTILRNVPATDAFIPDDVALGLCDYANRLRADASRAATGQPDRSRRDSAPACKLTYRQAVLWVDPLLAALEEANGKLAAIREADAARAGGVDAHQ